MLPCMNSVKFHFHGKAAHAAGHPFDGRSALDAVELMNVSANYMREHVKPDVRLHYATICSCAPNVVPDECSVWYYIRAPKRKDVDEVYSWLVDCAKGAALMTQTNLTSSSSPDAVRSCRTTCLRKSCFRRTRIPGAEVYARGLRICQENGGDVPGGSGKRSPYHERRVRR